MSRLLFAAARGARIQDNALGRWTASEFLHLCKADYEYRIHPEDTHLQYGPVSNALRIRAETGKDPHTVSGLLARTAFWHEWQYPDSSEDYAAYNQMLALILAEALADEGL